MAGPRKITFIMFKRRGKHMLAACRGEAKGCRVLPKVRTKLGPCDDCFICTDENETMQQIYDKLTKGNA